MTENVKELLKAHRTLRHEVYLDIENSAPVPQEIVEAMLPYFNQNAYGNPTLTHKPGWEAYETIMECSQRISSFIGCQNPEEVNFTPGETEANNLAVIGATHLPRQKAKMIISEIEPLSVLHVAEMLQKRGFAVQKIPVDREGFLNLDRLTDAVDNDTALVSLSAVNHEVGTIQPIKEAVDIVRDENKEAIFHTDASDAFGKVPFDVQELDVDLATISSYKILGPRGIGCLYAREGIGLERVLEGQIGTQRLWPGVENTPLIVGFTKASELMFQGFEHNVQKMRRLRDRLLDGLTMTVSDVELNGPEGEKRAPDNVNLSFLRCEGEALTIELSLNGVYVSSGSACSRRLLQPSHVLVALGKKFDQAHGSLLMKVSRVHTEEDINYTLQVIPKAVERIRAIAGSAGVM